MNTPALSRTTRSSSVLPRSRRRSGALSLLALSLAVSPISRADHDDAPGVAGDPAVDLADLYAWQTEDERIALVLTYAAGMAPGAEPIYDPDVLYSIWIDTDDDELGDLPIQIRFGQNPQTQAWGVQIRHVPGARADLVGPVEETLEVGTARAWVGPADDPFFFDAEGLQTSIATESLAFDASRDTFAGANAMAIVVDLDAGSLVRPGVPLRFHASAGRAR